MGVEARARVKGGFRGTLGTPPRSATACSNSSTLVFRKTYPGLLFDQESCTQCFLTLVLNLEKGSVGH